MNVDHQQVEIVGIFLVSFFTMESLNLYKFIREL
jgi:hypothetical protein